jgi:hypothetical protein
VRQIPFFQQKSKSIFWINIFAIFLRIINNYKLLKLSLIQSFFLRTLDAKNFAWVLAWGNIVTNCNVRQIFCSLHIFLIKKYFSVISSVFDKTRQKQKSKNINRILQHLETSEVWFECRESPKYVTCVSSFYPKYIFHI